MRHIVGVVGIVFALSSIDPDLPDKYWTIGLLLMGGYIFTELISLNR